MALDSLWALAPDLSVEANFKKCKRKQHRKIIKSNWTGGPSPPDPPVRTDRPLGGGGLPPPPSTPPLLKKGGAVGRGGRGG